MQTKATLDEQGQIPPNGTYSGTWGGCYVRFAVGEWMFRAKTDIGIRTPAVYCTVTVSDGIITVATK